MISGYKNHFLTATTTLTLSSLPRATAILQRMAAALFTRYGSSFMDVNCTSPEQDGWKGWSDSSDRIFSAFYAFASFPFRLSMNARVASRSIAAFYPVTVLPSASTYFNPNIYRTTIATSSFVMTSQSPSQASTTASTSAICASNISGVLMTPQPLNGASPMARLTASNPATRAQSSAASMTQEPYYSIRIRSDAKLGL